jgi:type II secretion system protein G
MTKTRGFTLIELLIVIAIILILIAIALPNFLEAQLRARVTKAKAELRSLNTALQSYYLDWDVYPDESEGAVTTSGEGLGLFKLTSPIKYITSIPEDPFGTFDSEGQSDTSFILYESGGMEVGPLNAMGGAYRGCSECMITWCMWSKGPDSAQAISGENPHYGGPVFNYSATNGSKSTGSLYVWGGDPFFIGVRMDSLNKKYAQDQRTKVGLLVDGQKYLHRLPPILP